MHLNFARKRVDCLSARTRRCWCLAHNTDESLGRQSSITDSVGNEHKLENVGYTNRMKNAAGRSAPAPAFVSYTHDTAVGVCVSPLALYVPARF